MNRNEQHAKQVDAWIELTVRDRPPNEQFRIFTEAVRVLQKRILITLSSVTLNAILDRTLHQSQATHPVLSKFTIDASGVATQDLSADLGGQSPEDVTQAIRFFLIELFSILENLTAGILTQPLYKELFQVTAAGPSKSSTDREDV